MTIGYSSNVAALVLPQRVTLAIAPELRLELRQTLGLGACHLLIDMSGVEFMDSSGLGLLVSALKTAKQRGGDVVLLGVKPNILSLLRLTRLDSVFTIAEDEADAFVRLQSVA